MLTNIQRTQNLFHMVLAIPLQSLEVSMKVTFLIMLFTLNTIAYAADDCDETTGTTFDDACILSKRVDELDKQLNVKYQQVIKEYKKSNSDSYVKLLIEAQRAWIRYRDKVCEFENEAIGGINAISYVRCKERITQTRLNEFNDY